MAEIPITKADTKKLKKKPKPGVELGFGKIFTDYLFLMDYKKGGGWKNPRIEPYRPLSLDPGGVGSSLRPRSLRGFEGLPMGQ